MLTVHKGEKLIQKEYKCFLYGKKDATAVTEFTSVESDATAATACELGLVWVCRMPRFSG